MFGGGGWGCGAHCIRVQYGVYRPQEYFLVCLNLLIQIVYFVAYAKDALLGVGYPLTCFSGKSVCALPISCVSIQIIICVQLSFSMHLCTYVWEMFTISPPGVALGPVSIKYHLSGYGDSYVKDKTVAGPSHLQHGDPYTGKKTSLFWDGLMLL